MNQLELNPGSQLRKLRAQIDAIDDSIFELLHRRLMLAQQIGKRKSRAGIPVEDDVREQEVIARLDSREERMRAALTAIYKEIFNQSRFLQQRERQLFPRLTEAGEHSEVIK